MAGEPILRSKIESDIAKYLDRADDPVVTDIVGTWFKFAHRKAQRVFNFSWMESFDVVTPLVEGGDQYPSSPLIKEILEGYIVDDLGNPTIRYRKTDVEEWKRHVLDGHYNEAIMSYYGGKYLLSPPTTNVTSLMELHVNAYMFQSVPDQTESDWLTVHGSDYLMYQSLVESVDYVSAPEGRVATWQARANEALNDLTNMNTQHKISGAMSVR